MNVRAYKCLRHLVNRINNVPETTVRDLIGLLFLGAFLSIVYITCATERGGRGPAGRALPQGVIKTILRYRYSKKTQTKENK